MANTSSQPQLSDCLGTYATGGTRPTDAFNVLGEAVLEHRCKLNTDAAAAYLGLARSTLEKLRVAGGGPHYLKIGRRVVYDVADLEQWLKDHRRQSTSHDLPATRGISHRAN